MLHTEITFSDKVMAKTSSTTVNRGKDDKRKSRKRRDAKTVESDTSRAQRLRKKETARLRQEGKYI